MNAAATIEPGVIWTVIIGMAIGSFALRFAFLGFVGGREIPAWLLRHLRYTAVAIIPALITPLVVWPAAAGGQPDLPRMSAAAVTVAVGFWTKNVIAAILCGAVTLYAMLFLLG